MFTANLIVRAFQYIKPLIPQQKLKYKNIYSHRFELAALPNVPLRRTSRVKKSWHKAA